MTMDEQQLAKIEAWIAAGGCQGHEDGDGNVSVCSCGDEYLSALVAEVRRLRAEFDRFKANARKYGIAHDVDQQHA